MEEIKRRADQYMDGLISDREFLGFCIEEIGETWSSGDCTPMADWLAILRLHDLKK